MLRLDFNAQEGYKLTLKNGETNTTEIFATRAKLRLRLDRFIKENQGRKVEVTEVLFGHLSGEDLTHGEHTFTWTIPKVDIDKVLFVDSPDELKFIITDENHKLKSQHDFTQYSDYRLMRSKRMHELNELEYVVIYPNTIPKINTILEWVRSSNEYKDEIISKSRHSAIKNIE